MEHTYKYTILIAIPDTRRGERVNIGIVVFKGDELDVRFRQASLKLKALTGAAWDSRINAVGERIKQTFQRGAPDDRILGEIQKVDPFITTVGLGEIVVHSMEAYEESVEEILTSLVLLPKKQKLERHSRINTEIARVFRKDKVLAKAAGDLHEHKIVRWYPVAPKEGLSADFALQNGALHVATTLDLRKQNVPIAEAALKAIVLDKSGQAFEDVKKIGVYAVTSDMKQQFRTHIELLSDYADETYNWLDHTQHSRFIRRMYDALPGAVMHRQ